MNAREFLDSMADVLRAHGHEVEVSATEEKFGTHVWMKSQGQRWDSPRLTLSAAHMNRTGRWELGELRVHMWDGETWVLRRYGVQRHIAAAVQGFAEQPCNGVCNCNGGHK